MAAEMEKRMILFFEAQGIQDIPKAVKRAKTETDYLSLSVSELNDKYGNIDKELSLLAKSYSHMEKKATTAIDKVTSKVKKLESATISSTARLGEAASALKGLVLPSSFGSALKLSLKYNKALLTLSVRTRSYSVGVVDLDKNIKRLSKSLYLTKEELTGLYENYISKMFIIPQGMQDFDNLLIRIKKMVGANSEAISGYIDKITTLSDSYPGLASEIANMKDGEEDLYEFRIRNLRASGLINQNTERSLLALLDTTKKMDPEEEKRIRTLKEHQDAYKQFKTQVESVKKAFGDALLPVLDKTAEMMKKVTGYFEGWGVSADVAAKAIIALTAAFIALRTAAATLAALQTLGLVAGAAGVVTGGAALAGGTALAGGAALAGGTAAGGTSALAGMAEIIQVEAAAAGTVAAEGITAGAVVATGLITAGFTVAAAEIAYAGHEIWKDAGEYKKAKKRQKELEDPNNYTNRMFAEKTAIDKITDPEEKRIKKTEWRTKYGLSQDSAAAKKERKASPIAVASGSLAAQLKYVGNLDKLFESSSANLDVMLETMKKTGDIDIGAAFSEVNKTVDLLQIKINNERKYLNEFTAFQSEFGTENKKSLKQLFKEGKLSQNVVDKIKEMGFAEGDVVDVLKVQEGLRATINKDELKKMEIVSKTNNLLQERLSLQQAETTIANSLISLADNYAIGVGASAKLRIMGFKAIGKEISMLRQAEQLQKQTIDNYKASGIAVPLAEKQKLLEIENSILGKQKEQASGIRALRDGWVSAMGAANTGSGRFTKIMFDQQKGLGTMLQMLGTTGVISSKSGRSGPGAGYGTSERFSKYGGIKNAKKGFAYNTWLDDEMEGAYPGYGSNFLGSIEKGHKKEVMMQMSRMMKHSGGIASSGGGAALGLMAHPYNKGPYLEGGGNTSITNNNNVTLYVRSDSDPKQTGKTVVKALQSFSGPRK